MDADVHNYLLDTLPQPRPFRCTSCQRIGMTAGPRPRCFGRQGDTHDAAPMKRVPERLRDQAVRLVIK
jgi:hypothetical protein